MKLLVAGPQGWLRSSACLFSLLVGSGVAQAQPVRATVILRAGDSPASGDGTAIQSLSYPRATESGKPVIVGGLSSDSAYVWVNDQVVWYGSQGPTTLFPDGSSTQGSCGANDLGNWVMQGQINGSSTIYTDAGPLLSVDDPAPGFG